MEAELFRPLFSSDIPVWCSREFPMDSRLRTPENILPRLVGFPGTLSSEGRLNDGGAEDWRWYVRELLIIPDS